MGVPQSGIVRRLVLGGPLAPNSPRPLGGHGMGPRRGLGHWELAEGGSWESLEDPGRGPAGAKLCIGPLGQRGKALLRTCHVKEQIPGPLTSVEGGTGSCFLCIRKLNMKNNPPGGNGVSPSPPRTPVSDPAHGPRAQSKAVLGALCPSSSPGLRRFQSKFREGSQSTPPGSSGG